MLIFEVKRREEESSSLVNRMSTAVSANAYGVAAGMLSRFFPLNCRMGR